MRRSTSSPRLLAAAAAASLLIAACGGSDGDSADTSAPDSAPATEPPATDPPVTEPPATDPPATDPPATEPPATDPPVTEPPATDPPVEDAADIAIGDGYGPYAVGVQTITIADTSGGERGLTVDVWFPLAPDLDGDLPLQQYTLVPGSYYESPFAVAAPADAIAVADAPFPLVIYSHGSGGLRYIHSNYTEAIASNGYIVAAPDHTGNTAADTLLGTAVDPAITAINRPNDVQRVIDAFLDPENVETVGFVANLNPDQIAVTGHSFGGFTAYAMASGYANENGEFIADERVDAIIPLAPAAGPTLLSDELLASIDIPAMVMVGTDDATTPVDPNVTRPWELTVSSPSYRLDLTAAEHETFTDVCAYQEFLPTLPDVLPAIVDTINARGEAGCGPDDMPIERAQDITNTFAVAFLDEVFKGGEPIAADQVDEQPDLVYLVK